MSATADIFAERLVIDDLVVDPATRQVERAGVGLKVSGLTFDLLVALAEAAPALASQEMLAEKVWNGRPVSPETLAQRVKMLREALGDDARQPRYVELVRGQGYRLLSEPRAPGAERAWRRRWLGLSLALAVVAAVGLGVALWPAAAPVPEASVAVLPFADRSPASDQQYLADGLAEELINQLGQLSGLDVASRTDSFFYRQPGDDVQSIGKALQVAAILEGSVLRVDDRLRVRVQLVDVGSGYHLWSSEFNRGFDDLIEIQTDIARAVAGALGIRLGAGGVNEFPGAGTENVDAYEAFLRDNHERATTLDPNYAAAWGRRGLRIAGSMWRHSPVEAPAILERAYEHVARAIELDPLNAEAQADFATMIYATMDWDRAERAFDAALELKRNDYNLTHYSNMMMRVGRSRRALQLQAEIERLRRIKMGGQFLDLHPRFALGQRRLLRDRIDTLESSRRWRLELYYELNFGEPVSLQAVLASRPSSDNRQERVIRELLTVFDQRAVLLEMLERFAAEPDLRWPDQYHFLALVAAFFDAPELALTIFERDVRNTTIRFGSLWFPVMADVRALPAFKEFLGDVNLVAYWRRYGWPDFCRPLGDSDFTCKGPGQLVR
ncbi:MAG: winged helix-turn-helix domain-containing protein [Pseudomonadota bacterium]